MSFYERMSECAAANQPDWRGRHQKRFRWRRLRFEYGRLCYIVHPIEGGRDIVWWEWDGP